jgi:hypothetical protein
MPIRFDLSAFSRRRSAKFAFAFLAPIVAITLVTFTVRAWRNQKGSAAKDYTVAAQARPTFDAIGYVSRARLGPRLRHSSEVLGDRLEKPGKERLILIGSLSRASKKNEDRPARMILEFPDRLRLEEQDGVTVYDNGDFASSNGVLKENERDEIESLLFDSADHFFAIQMQGTSTRFLGSRFRLDDGANPHYTGPFYDLYQITDRIAVRQEVRTRQKLYYFNSDSLLLERVRYKIERGGEPIKVEVTIGGWRKVDGQQIPGNITRTEDGSPVLSLSITSAMITGKLNDGIWGGQ